MILASADFGVSFFVELATLLLIAYLVYRYIWHGGLRLGARLDAQQDAIRSQFAAADEAKAAAAALLEERRAELAAARTEAEAIVEQSRRSAQFLLDDGARRAEDDYRRIVGRIPAEIDAARLRAHEEVLAELGEVVVAMTEIVVRAELDEGTQRRLIDAAISATETVGDEAVLA